MATPPAGTRQQPTAAQEWRANWTLVLAAAIGLSFGSIPAATLGLFMEPLESEFGWSRAMISAGMMVFASITLPFTPFAGAIVDKVGARRCAIPGLALSGLCFAAFSLMTGATWQWWGVWVLYSFAALFIRSMVWNQAVSNAFSASRGLAIAVVLSGLALAQIIAPPLLHFLMAMSGWRLGYAVLGIGWAGIGVLLVILFFKVRPQASAAQGGGNSTQHLQDQPGGLSMQEAMRSVAIYRIGFSMLLTFTIGAAISIHIVPLLEWAGTTRTQAATLAAVLGLGSLAGKLLTGWLLDRIQGGLLPFAVISSPALGYLLIWQSGANILILGAGVLLMGYGSGGALQMGTYLTTRYAGMRNFGKIYGVISSFIGLAGGLGPILSGAIYDATGSYETALLIAIPSMVVAGLAVIGLGPYPDFDRRTAESEGKTYG